jgi:hypothetical protein
MNLGQLKTSLARFSPDMDDTEVILAFQVGDKEDLDLLAFVGYVDLPTSGAVILGSDKAARSRMLDKIKQ